MRSQGTVFGCELRSSYWLRCKHSGGAIALRIGRNLILRAPGGGFYICGQGTVWGDVKWTLFYKAKPAFSFFLSFLKLYCTIVMVWLCSDEFQHTLKATDSIVHLWECKNNKLKNLFLSHVSVTQGARHAGIVRTLGRDLNTWPLDSWQGTTNLTPLKTMHRGFGTEGCEFGSFCGLYWGLAT